MKGKGNAARVALAVSVMLALVSSPVWADPPPGRGKPDKSAKHAGKKDWKGKKNGESRPLARAGISAEAARRLALEAHVTGYRALPPGIAKNLARGKPLPPGIARKTVPSSLLGRLPHHAGYEWQVAGTDLILVAVATDIVAEVLSGVFR